MGMKSKLVKIFGCVALVSNGVLLNFAGAVGGEYDQKMKDGKFEEAQKLGERKQKAYEKQERALGKVEDANNAALFPNGRVDREIKAGKREAKKNARKWGDKGLKAFRAREGKPILGERKEGDFTVIHSDKPVVIKNGKVVKD